MLLIVIQKRKNQHCTLDQGYLYFTAQYTVIRIKTSLDSYVFVSGHWVQTCKGMFYQLYQSRTCITFYSIQAVLLPPLGFTAPRQSLKQMEQGAELEHLHSPCHPLHFSSDWLCEVNSSCWATEEAFVSHHITSDLVQHFILWWRWAWIDFCVVILRGSYTTAKTPFSGY